MESKTRAANERETAVRPLDAAEQLFGRLGDDSVGMQAQAAEAEAKARDQPLSAEKIVDCMMRPALMPELEPP